MEVGDLVQMKDTRYHKVHWADGRVLWESDRWIKAVKKCP